MLRRSCSVGFAVLLVALLVFAGCSDNETSTGPITGDPNSTEFQNTKAAIASALDSTMGIALQLATTPNKFPEDTTNLRADLGIFNPNDSVYYDYSETTGWNILYIGMFSLANYTDIYVDSVRFMEADRFTAVPLITTQRIDFIRHQSNTYTGSGDTYEEYEIYFDIDFSEFDQATKTLNGVGEIVIDDYNGSTNDTYEFDVTVSTINFTINDQVTWPSQEIVSGSITLSGTESDGTNSQNWSVTATFASDGTTSISATTGNTNYQYSQTVLGQ